MFGNMKTTGMKIGEIRGWYIGRLTPLSDWIHDSRKANRRHYENNPMEGETGRHEDEGAYRRIEMSESTERTKTAEAEYLKEGI